MEKDFEKFLTFLKESDYSLCENTEKAARNVYTNLAIARTVAYQVLGLDANFTDIYEVYQMLLRERDTITRDNAIAFQKTLNAPLKGSEGGDSA